MGELYEKLKAYDESGYDPYHMPGHKRRLGGSVLERIASLDITEIDGFDNLHDAEGILKRLQEKAARVYGAEESFYLVNGSTAGVLAAISAAVPQGGKILLDRGAHRSAYHAVYLRNLDARYLTADSIEGFGCRDRIRPRQVEKALAEEPDIRAVFLVSPTYEGIVSDIEEIAKIVHARGIPLIVDEAHGAHLGFHPAWPQNSSRLGADMVIQSLHKTLPSPTQTALLHVNGNLADRRKLRRFLSIYQSSSPSYVLMAAMEEALEITAGRAEELFGAFLRRWDTMLAELEQCRCLRFLRTEGMDKGKLVITDRSGTLTGKELYERLLERYRLQPEMAAGNYVLAMFTIGDTEEGFCRMTRALLETDKELREGSDGGKKQKEFSWPDINRLPPRALSPGEAWERAGEKIPLSRAAGRTASEFVFLYPPGIPLLVPGECFTEEICGYIRCCVENGLRVTGVSSAGGERMGTEARAAGMEAMVTVLKREER